MIDGATSEERRRKCPIERRRRRKGEREGRGRWHLQYLRFFCNPEMLARLSQTPEEEEDNGYELEATSLGQSQSDRLRLGHPAE